MTPKSNIVCIWYPSGGFGHFVNAILTLHGTKFVRPKQITVEFGRDGNSHNLDLVAPKYLHEPKDYSFDFPETNLYSVLIDNGINNESKRFMYEFPRARVIKVCYTDFSWPIVARTSIMKAMRTEFDELLMRPGIRRPTEDFEPWEFREQYFLYLRDHKLRYAWHAETTEKRVLNLNIDQLLDYSSLHNYLSAYGFETEDFENLWFTWRQANAQYIDPILKAQHVIDCIQENRNFDLVGYQDLWTQAVTNYYIWLEFNFEVPANDYSNWFTNTQDIVKMLESHGILY